MSLWPMLSFYLEPQRKIIALFKGISFPFYHNGYECRISGVVC